MNQFGHGGEKALLARLSAGRACTRCFLRYRQSADGLCRRCQHELGLPAPPVIEQDAERLRRQRARAATIYGPHRTPKQRELHAALMRKPRTVDVHPSLSFRDRDYVVVWAGDMDGAEAMGLPMADQKKGSYTGIERERLAPERKGSGPRRPGAFERD